MLLYVKILGNGWSFRCKTGGASKQKHIWYTYKHKYSSRTHTYKHTSTYAHIQTHTYKNAYKHTYKNAYKHAYKRTYAHIQAHTCCYMQKW